MAKLKLNVAGRPFINTRPLNLLLAGAVIGLSGLTFRSVYRLFDALATSRVLSAQTIVDVTARSEALAETAKLNAAISKAEALRIRRVAGAIKEVIQHRQLSWSRLLDHLAAVVPADVRIMSVDPAGGDDQIALVLECVAKDHDSKRALYAVLNRPPFSHGYIMHQAVDPTGKIAFTVNCDYDPGAPAVVQLAAVAAGGAEAAVDVDAAAPPGAAVRPELARGGP